MNIRLLDIAFAAALTGVCAGWLSPVQAQVFQDDFNVAGTTPNPALWTTEIGPSSFLGRTQLRDWSSRNSSAQFPVSGGAARLALDTYNPFTGVTPALYGSHAKTIQSFQATAATGYVFSTQLQLTSLQPGLVYGMYFYGCALGTCATEHDELDIEIVTNYLQPGIAPRVQVNRYSNEPLGAGHGPVVNLPSNFDPLALHNWQIRWQLNQVTYSVDETVIFTAHDFIPQGSMQANIIAWAPGAEWRDAYHASLQPALSAGANQSFVAQVDSVTVAAVPEPEQWAMFGLGLTMIVFASSRTRVGHIANSA